VSTLQAVRIFRTVALFIAPFCMAHASVLNTVDGTITVTDVVTPIGPLFQYNYTVGDATGLLIDLDIAVSTGISITNFAAPGGVNTPGSAFTAVTDTVSTGSGTQEFVSFLENQGAFSSTPQSGFIFDSTIAPAAGTFGITLGDGATATASGITAPVAPEPASAALCLLGVSALVFWLYEALSQNPFFDPRAALAAMNAVQDLGAIAAAGNNH